MEFTSGQYAQLIIALALGVTIFVAAYAAPPRWSVAVLIVLVPFQMIGSRFGTLNMVLIYLVGVAFFFRGKIRHLPMVGFFLFIMFAYMLSVSQSFRQTYADHGFYLIGICANFVLFYIVFNHFRDNQDLRQAFRLLIWMNLLVIAYCVLQIATGVERFSFLGISELSLAEKEVAQQRLVGPFGAPGTNGEFFVLQIFVLAYMIIHTAIRSHRWFLVAVLLTNFALLIMTGSRGSFLAFLGGAFLFLFMFRRQLGFGRVLRISAIGAVGFVVVVGLVLNFSQFNVLFDRLAETEFEGALPDTRAKAFTYAFEGIPEKPMLGHGPRLRLMNEDTRRIRGYTTIPYPHNLYLFLLYTVGIVGLFAYLTLFAALFLRWRKASKFKTGDPFRDGLATLGMFLLIVFLIDQLKVEFLRLRLSDHQQYIFSIWALLLAATDRMRLTGAPSPSAPATAVAPVDSTANSGTTA